MKKNKPKLEISIVIVNYNGKKFIKKLFESIKNQNFKDYEIIFHDNASADGSVEYLKKNYLTKKPFSENTILIQSTRNTGFAEGNNIAIKQASGKYVFFLNTDTTLEKDTLNKLYKVIEKDPLIAGVTPKVYLSRFLPLRVFDSVGMCMDHNGSPYNKGIGQLDLGQYDQEEELMGICFAACLVRKDIFWELDGLDEDYFAYFEDVDWCFRARKHGYKFFSVPDSIVNHLHSGTTSTLSYAWKYKQIFQNYLRTVVKDFGKNNLLRIVLLKNRDLVKELFNKNHEDHLKKTIKEVLWRFWTHDLFAYFFKRSHVRKNFIPDITDESIFSYSFNEPSSFFDPITYEPKINLAMIDFIVYKRNHHSPNKKMIKAWEDLKDTRYAAESLKDWVKKFEKFVIKYLESKISKKELSTISKKLVSSLE